MFLEEELQAETNAFKQKLDTSARYLLTEREELFVAKFIAFKDGEMILKFSLRSALPRKGEYLFCFTTPKELHNFKNWGEKTYGDLLHSKGYGTESIFIWHSPIQEEPGFCLAGFRGVDGEFMNHLDGKTGAILILGPNVPPYEYITNLQKIVKTSDEDMVEPIESCEGTEGPIVLNSDSNISGFIREQLSFSDSLVLMGPPGTGKTTQIAELCHALCEDGYSVLVTALTNRALLEVAHKKSLQSLLKKDMVFKTKITVDEAMELPRLNLMKSISVIPGALVLSTYYITSGFATEVAGPPAFDYIIMDEASQALTAMFTAVKKLGKRRLFVGDINQLPPVTEISKERVEKRGYSSFINGLWEVSSTQGVPTYMLSETWRLPERGAHYTGHFYSDKLISKSKQSSLLKPIGIEPWLNKILSDEGGPSLVMTDMNLGDKKPLSGIGIATVITSSLMSADNDLRIAVLTFYVESAKSLQRQIYSEVGGADRLIVDTVSRVQGLTTDVVIFMIPNTGYIWSLARGLFNVATSRARKHTIIISDKSICERASHADPDVRRFLNELEMEKSVYFPVSTDKKQIPALDMKLAIDGDVSA